MKQSITVEPPLICWYWARTATTRWSGRSPPAGRAEHREAGRARAGAAPGLPRSASTTPACSARRHAASRRRGRARGVRPSFTRRPAVTPSSSRSTWTGWWPRASCSSTTRRVAPMRLPDELRRQVVLVALLGRSAWVGFEYHVVDLVATFTARETCRFSRKSNGPAARQCCASMGVVIGMRSAPSSIARSHGRCCARAVMRWARPRGLRWWTRCLG